MATTPAGIEFVRTPEECFEGIEGYDYQPNYVDIDGLRMAWVDEGSAEFGHTILLPHGEPTWGYLYRFMIPTLVRAGHRVIVPDLVGFGRSDKPVQRSAYTYDAHVGWMRSFLDEIDPGPLAVFCQDWGGLISLRLAGEEPERFNRIVAGNTALPVGEPLGDGFAFWLDMSQTVENLDCGRLIASTSLRGLTDAERAAYSAPFPDESFMAGVREFPALVPVTPQHASVAENVAAWETLDKWEKPFLTLWGTADPVLGHLGPEMVDRIPGAQGQPHQAFVDGSHFIQDDKGPELAEAIIAWLR